MNDDLWRTREADRLVVLGVGLSWLDSGDEIICPDRGWSSLRIRTPLLPQLAHIDCTVADVFTILPQTNQP
jgi:hypothetical protein